MDVYMIICASLCILIFSVALWSDIRRVIKIRERRKEIQEYDKDGLSAEYNIFPLSEFHYYNFKEKQNMDGRCHLYGAIIGAVAIVAVIILGEYVAVVVPVFIILTYLEAAKSYKMLYCCKIRNKKNENIWVMPKERRYNNMAVIKGFPIFFRKLFLFFSIKCFPSCVN